MSESTPRKVGFNRGSLVELALYGRQDLKEAFYRETRRTVARLKLDTTGVRPLTGAPGRGGPAPNLHDIIRWLDDVKAGDPLYFKDRKFLLRLHVTLQGQVHPNVLKED